MRVEHLARHLSSPAQRVIKDAQGAGFVYESVAFATCRHANEVLEVASYPFYKGVGIVGDESDF